MYRHKVLFIAQLQLENLMEGCATMLKESRIQLQNN
jgi:hypothetical protein